MVAPARPKETPVVLTNAACPHCDGPLHVTRTRGPFCPRPGCPGTKVGRPAKSKKGAA